MVCNYLVQLSLDTSQLDISADEWHLLDRSNQLSRSSPLLKQRVLGC